MKLFFITQKVMPVEVIKEWDKKPYELIYDKQIL